MKQAKSRREEGQSVTGSTSYYEGRESIDEDRNLQPSENIHEDVSIFTQRYGLMPDALVFTKAAALLQDDVPLSSIRGLSEYELVALSNETHRKWRQPKLMYLTIAMTALGAMGQGWAQTGSYVHQLGCWGL